MHRPYLLLLCLTLAWTLACAAPSRPLVNRNPKRSLDAGGLDERREWGRRLVRRQVVATPAVAAAAATSATFVAAPVETTTAAAVTTSSVAVPETTATSEPTTSATTTEADETSTVSVPAASSSAESSASEPASTTATSSAVSSASSSTESASTSTTRSASRHASSTSSAEPSASAAADHEDEDDKKKESNKSSGSIFSPSNRLFGLGIVIIIAIIVLTLLASIYIIKRLSHLPRYADERDYPDGFPRTFLDDKALSKRYSHQSQAGLLDGAAMPAGRWGEGDAKELPGAVGGEEEFGAALGFLPRAREGQRQVEHDVARPARGSSLVGPGLPRASTAPPAPTSEAPRRPSLPAALKSVPLPPLPPVSSSASLSAPPPLQHHQQHQLQQQARRPPPPPPNFSRPSSSASAGPNRLHRKPPPPPLKPESLTTTTTTDNDRLTALPRGMRKHPHSPPRSRMATPIRRKLVIVGDGACGKTSLLSVFAMGEFPSEYEPTIFENYVAEIRLDGKAVQLALWDTAGQEEYERLRPLSYSQSHVILIAFALDTPDSLDNVQVKWIDEVRSLCGPAIPVILVGCKADLREQAMQQGGGDRGRFVTTEQGERIASSIGARTYRECSALHNQGVDELFEAATRAAMLVRGHGAGGGGGGGEEHHHAGAAEKAERRRSGGAGRRDEEEGKGGCCGCVIL
ncbi:hypothetical protein JCM8097_001102 [Rhodosporidiobolus ruineniae]